MRKTLLLLAALMAAGVFDSSESQAQSERHVFYRGKSYCGDQYFKWERRRGHWMGFAINEKIGRKQSCGWSLNAFTKQAAIAKAMAKCREMSRKSPKLGHPSSCFLYDIK